MTNRIIATVIALAVFLSLPVGFGAAQPGVEPGDNTVIVYDAPRDVQFAVGTRAGTPAQNASSLGSQFDHIDILDVTYGEETEAEFQIVLRLAALDPPSTNSGFPIRLVYFSYGELDWLIFSGGCRQFGGSGQVEVAGCLMYRDNPGAQARPVKTIPAAKEDGAFVFTVSKQDIFNEQRLPAQYGQTIRNLYAYATQTYATTQFLQGADMVGSVSAYDRAPDGGFSKVDFTFQEGSGGHGFLGLTSPDPIRVSNGEATTIVYLAEAHNTGDADLKVQVTTKDDLRSDWSVRVPPIVNVPAQQTVEFPVVLTVPFSHDHGRTVMFTVHAEAIEDPQSFADLPLGVWWTDVPQPSAHHNGELWFHSAPAEFGAFPEAGAAAVPFKQYWINSIEEDPNPLATDENAAAFFNDYFFCPFSGGGGAPNPAACGTPPTYSASWFFPLSPSLLIGLDFDVAREGMLNAEIVASLPATTATLDVELRYCDPENGSRGGGGGGFGQNATACTNFQTVLAKGSMTRALTAQQKAKFEVPLTIEPTADYLPFKRGTNIGLRVRLLTDLPQNTIMTEPRPQFDIKNSRLFLPLIEFHDALAPEFAELGALRVSALDPYEKPVNAGRTTLFDFEVENNDHEVQVLALEIEGVNKEWARLLGPSEIELAVKQRVNFTIAIEVPGDAVTEERAELVVIAQSKHEPAVTGIARMRATVVSEDVPDEAGSIQVAQKTKTPGLGGGILVAVVAAVAVLHGRLSRRRA